MAELILRGYCQCGCGGKTKIARKTASGRGHWRGQPLRYIHGHHRAKTEWPFRLEPAPGFLNPLLGPCWIWIRGLTTMGYGAYSSRKDFTKQLAHRVIYEAQRGYIDPDKEIDHLCRRPPCVNPAHLEPVPPTVNVQRGNTARLTPILVREIRLSTQNSDELARRLGVHVNTIKRVRRRATWKNVA